MEKRSITIKSEESFKAKADYISIEITLYSLDKEYSKMIANEEEKIKEISAALVNVGFQKKEIKTLDFNISTKTESIRDGNGNYYDECQGYQCQHILKIAFDYDAHIIRKVLTSITVCKCAPNIDISFTVKNPNEIKDELLRKIAKSAKRKADVLCTAAGNTLGQLLQIDYNWTKMTIVSRSRFRVGGVKKWFFDEEGISPDDIEVEDSATFTWEII